MNDVRFFGLREFSIGHLCVCCRRAGCCIVLFSRSLSGGAAIVVSLVERGLHTHQSQGIGAEAAAAAAAGSLPQGDLPNFGVLIQKSVP